MEDNNRQMAVTRSGCWLPHRSAGQMVLSLENYQCVDKRWLEGKYRCANGGLHRWMPSCNVSFCPLQCCCQLLNKVAP